jgi:hypothetical protein
LKKADEFVWDDEAQKAFKPPKESLTTPPIMTLKDRLGDQSGGSEWEPIKILLQRENLAFVLKSQPRIPTRVCQGHIVTTDLPTLGTHPK